MRFCHRMAVLAIICAVSVGCERAQRYPPVPQTTIKPAPSVVPDDKPEPVPPFYGWIDPDPYIKFNPRLDIPLQFIAEDNNAKEWQALKDYWNESPPPAGVRTLALGLPPLEAAVALAAQLGVESIKIKVPRGLPDPTPLIPAANPPTFGQWLLGKRLFFDAKLLRMSPTLTRSCADCHQPSQAFALNVEMPESGYRNVPSLLNSVYNRHQFWDGRADALEQVLLRQLEDEREAGKEPPVDQSPGYLHVWPGVVSKLRGTDSYVGAFQAVYGTDATADNVAKALATYMRTLLSGDALVDKAQAHQIQRGGATLDAGDFEPFLSGKALEQLPSTLSTKETAQQMARGHALFHGQARCSICHGGPLFTDGGFHNIGIGESERLPSPGKETGRFAFVPLGLKDRRLIGAFKTPSLRNVSLTAPYMHDGSLATLATVLRYFNDGIDGMMKWYLDPELSVGPSKSRRLGLGPEDLQALELYLLGLRGEELPAVVTKTSAPYSTR